jgi:hypothetical protein
MGNRDHLERNIAAFLRLEKSLNNPDTMTGGPDG